MVVKRVQVFYGGQSQGSKHIVIMGHASTSELFEALPKASHLSLDVLIAVQLPHSGASGTIAFRHNGRSVSRCGSGSVAASWTIKNFSPIALTHLSSNIETIELTNMGSFCGYWTKSLPYHHPNTAFTLLNALGAAPQKIIFCGADQDYVIAVFGSQKDVAELTPNHSVICQATQRSIIATAPSSDSDFDYVLRYFSPQWGNPEDTATGSANAMVAPYWANKLNQSKLSALQLSQVKGEIQCSVNIGDRNTATAESALFERSYRVQILGRCKEVD